MPRVRFGGQDIVCPVGANLRDVLKGAGLPPHNGNATWLNCKGIGTCGTCAVEVEGPTSPRNGREQWRLHMPPHEHGDQLRLACQVEVRGDLTVQKHDGFWGQHLTEPTS